MHSNKFRDPLISRAQPVTIITPVVDETLRLAGVPAVREQILDRFMNGQPRIAVVHGGEDHPPNVGSKETIRRVIRQIWANCSKCSAGSNQVARQVFSIGSIDRRVQCRCSA